jgi:hypothetical protein
VIFGFLNSVITFPLKVYSGYILEHRFALSNQSFPAWLWDGVKGLLIGAVIGTPILLLFYFFPPNLRNELVAAGRNHYDYILGHSCAAGTDADLSSYSISLNR